MEENKLRFHVSGMHCRSCELYLESELENFPGMISVKPRLKDHSLEVTGQFKEKTPETIAKELTEVVERRGYRISLEKQAASRKLSEFLVAVPLAAVFLGLFVLLQKLGVVNIISSGAMSYGTAFIVGIVASLSTCMAVVGGLLLSLSATFAKEGESFKPQAYFHVGRLASFFVLGGLVGALGSAFRMGSQMTSVLGFLVAAVMLILGVNLLDVFPWAKRLQPSLPKFLTKRAFSAARVNHKAAPFLAGLATFFLPCGFTQSMQVYTLTTGSFLKGGLTMFAFSLGTLPVLALISFSFLKISDQPKASVFFKTAGLVVIMFAMFNLLNSLVVVGLLPPIFNF